MLEKRKSLPVYNYKTVILDLIKASQVVVIKGATGCGKTTQVPQYILDEYLMHGDGINCNVVVTQVIWFNPPPLPPSVVSSSSQFATLQDFLWCCCQSFNFMSPSEQVSCHLCFESILSIEYLSAFEQFFCYLSLPSLMSFSSLLNAFTL